ncbi:MAG: isoleucine--tRNA ligase, partial [Gammaproteobacteria bacterium]|nr:isoleucine--tRNA ligase [Gammaproteobacteria bacterium]
IGGNLQAQVTLYADAALAEKLNRLGDELRFVLITSTAQVADLSAAPADAVETELAGLKLHISKSEEPKCTRCWHHRADVGSVAAHPEACARCADNLDGAGEVRHYA